MSRVRCVELPYCRNVACGFVEKLHTGVASAGCWGSTCANDLVFTPSFYTFSHTCEDLVLWFRQFSPLWTYTPHSALLVLSFPQFSRDTRAIAHTHKIKHRINALTPQNQPKTRRLGYEHIFNTHVKPSQCSRPGSFFFLVVHETMRLFAPRGDTTQNPRQVCFVE